MFYRRVYNRGNAEIRRDSFSATSLRTLRLIFLFLFLIKIPFAQTNQQYDINDPRNPNCPCHKYQKMADDEFEQLQKKNKSNQSVELAELGDNPNLKAKERQLKESESTSNRPHSNYAKRKKWKTIKRRMHKHVNLFSLRSFKAKRFKPCYSVCFKW